MDARSGTTNSGTRDKLARSFVPSPSGKRLSFVRIFRPLRSSSPPQLNGPKTIEHEELVPASEKKAAPIAAPQHSASGADTRQKISQKLGPQAMMDVAGFPP
jgi:hypothetical protein